MRDSFSFSYRLISPDTISSEDLDWSLHPWTGKQIPEELVNSFNRSGIVNPPSLFPATKKNQYKVLAGYRRICFSKSCYPDKKILCKCYKDQPPPEQCLYLVLDDQQFSSNSLSIAEKARFLHLASSLIPTSQILEEYLPLLQLKKNPELLKNLLNLSREEKPFLDATHSGQLSLQIYTELQRMSKKERAALLDLFTTLQLGGGKQQKFLQQIRDCAYARELSIIEFLTKKEIKQILEHSHLNIPQKIQHLGDLLQTFIQPNLYRAQENFNEQIRLLALPENYTVSPSQSFEKDEVTLKISFADLNSCQQFLQDVKKQTRNSGLYR